MEQNFVFLFFSLYYFSLITFNSDLKLQFVAIFLWYFLFKKIIWFCVFLISRTNSEQVWFLIPNPHFTFHARHTEVTYPLTHLLIDSLITPHGRSPQDHILISIFLQTETQINGSGWFAVDTGGAVKKQNTLIRWEWVWELKKPPRLARRTRALIINEKMGVIAETAMSITAYIMWYMD